MALPHGTTGSLGPPFSSVRGVPLTVKRAYTLALARAIANRPEPAFALLRYSFGGDRPSQTNHLARFPARVHGIGVRRRLPTGWYFTVGSPVAETGGSTPPTYPTQSTPGVSTRL